MDYDVAVCQFSIGGELHMVKAIGEWLYCLCAVQHCLFDSCIAEDVKIKATAICQAHIVDSKLQTTPT